MLVGVGLVGLSRIRRVRLPRPGILAAAATVLALAALPFLGAPSAQADTGVSSADCDNAPPAVLPEAPAVILVPLAGAAALGALVLIRLRSVHRHSA